MFIVFADDKTVTVLRDIDSVRRECETVDVEDGIYTFFDELGRHLLPTWTAPVQRKSGFLGSVSGGSFELKLDPEDSGSSFHASIADVVLLESNPLFETISDLISYVESNQADQVR